MENTEIVQYLNYLVKTYDGITQLIASTHQRLISLPGIEDDTNCDTTLKGIENEHGKQEGLLTVKGRLNRAIEKELVHWDEWNEWLKVIPGIGPVLAAKLIILFNYKFVPVCKDCGGILEKKKTTEENGKEINRLACTKCGKVAKDGVLNHRMEQKDFQTISKWWAYMGRHTVEGAMPKRKAGVVSNWSTEGRTLGFHIGDQFNRQKEDHPYKKLLLERKAKHQRNHPEWSKGHVHNAAKNEVVKIFLSHFWVVSRTIQGKPISEPYAGALMGHTNIIEPFYWSESKCETHYGAASQNKNETQELIASQKRSETQNVVASQFIVETQRKDASHCHSETQKLSASQKSIETQSLVASQFIVETQRKDASHCHSETHR